MIRKFSFVWVTLVLFLGSMVGHWSFAWYAYVAEKNGENQEVDVKEFLLIASRDTFENWQSEFLQLIWQVGGLTYLLYTGSPQSKDGDERKEEKLDLILRTVNPGQAEQMIRDLESKFPKR